MWEIYSFLSWQWLLGLVWFGVAIVFSWFVPGLVLLTKAGVSSKAKFYVAPILGISLWAIQGYFFGWLNLRWLTYVYLFGFSSYFIYQFKNIQPIKFELNLPKKIWLILAIGVILQLVPVFGSGWRSQTGISYYFVNIFDGLFHLSLERALVDHIPPFQPGAAGLPVTNYHYLGDLVLAELGRVWQLPINHLYFQYLPSFMSIWFGLTLLVLLRNWSNSTWTLGAGLILFYGVGELSWLVNIFLGGQSKVPFEVFIDHGILQFLNQPQAFAKFCLFGILILSQEFRQRQTIKLAGLIALMTATLVGFKVYFGLAGFVGFGLAGGYYFVSELIQAFKQTGTTKFGQFFNRIKLLFFLGLVAASLAATIYLPTNSQAGGIFFDLLTWPKLLLGATKLNWNEWWLRLQVYDQAGSLKNLTIWYAVAAGIFGLAIYHLRSLGILVFWPKLRAKISVPELWFCLPTAIIFGFIGANFLQTSGGANSFNFTVVAITLLNLLTAIVIGQLAKSKASQLLIMSLFSLTMVQTVAMEYFYLKNYLLKYDSQLISSSHESALKYLSLQPKSTTVVQTFPNHYLDATTPYGYFFSGQSSYLGGRGILESHNQPISERVKNVQKLLDSDPVQSALLARQLAITHLLLNKHQTLENNFVLKAAISATNSALPGWKEVYLNSEISVLSPQVPADWLLKYPAI